MRVAIRTDASLNIGSGHVMRCLTLAKKLKKAGADVRFICRDHAGNILKEVTSAGFPLTVLQTDPDCRISEGDEYALWLGVSQAHDAAQTIRELTKMPGLDWLIVDHYGLDNRWEEATRPYAEQIMVIDDLANRKHDCDLILDQNLYANMKSRYDELVPKNCIKKLGPEYALLRDEFFEERRKLRNRDGVVRRVLVFYGASDNSGETLKALEAIIRLELTSVNFDIIVGFSNKDIDNIRGLCSKHENLNFYSEISNMAELMAQADLALGAGGTTTYERYCLGLPAIVTSIASNQVEAAEFAYKSGLNFYIGKSMEVTREKIGNCLNRLINDCETVKKTSQKLLSLLDDSGSDIIHDFCLEEV